jgi:hypothetical protein
MKKKKVLKPVDKKYEQIFKVWNEPRIDYEVKKPKSITNSFIKTLLHPLSILTMLTIGMVIYTFEKCFGR